MYSNQRRNERYKIIYIWKSLYNIVPSLGLIWNQEGSVCFGPKLKVDKIFGPNEKIKNLKRDSLRNFGVQIFNMLPVEIRTFQGTLEGFKSLLDSYISQCPDQPLMEVLKPQAKDIFGNPSNSLIDWMRIVKFIDKNDLIVSNAVEAQP